MLGAKQTRFLQSAKEHISGVDRAASPRQRRRACRQRVLVKSRLPAKVYASNIALNE